MEWWLTRESGVVPSLRGEALRVRPRAYLIVHLSCALCGLDLVETAFARLSRRTVEVVARRIVPLMLRVRCRVLPEAGVGGGADLPGWVEEAKGLFLSLHGGAYSCGMGCLCSGAVTCVRCSTVTEGNRVFVWQSTYEGVSPCTKRPWWLGITDGVGPTTGLNRGWYGARGGYA